MKKLSEEVETFKKRHSQVLSTMTDEQIPVDSKILKIPSIISVYSELYHEYSIKYSELIQKRDRCFKDVYYKIKIGSHELSNLGLTSHQEIKTLTQGDETFLELEKNIRDVESFLKLIEKYQKAISDLGFHFRLQLDWKKFREGEN